MLGRVTDYRVGPWLILFACCGLGGCASTGASLQQAEQLYGEARYEAALEWLQDLEANTAAMQPRQRTKFYYLRGMAAYRLSHRDDALHFLALAAAASGSSALPPELLPVMEHALQELIPHEATHHARNPLQRDTL
jgi:hypothetical protein